MNDVKISRKIKFKTNIQTHRGPRSTTDLASGKIRLCGRLSSLSPRNGIKNVVQGRGERRNKDQLLEQQQQQQKTLKNNNETKNRSVCIKLNLNQLLPRSQRVRSLRFPLIRATLKFHAIHVSAPAVSPCWSLLSSLATPQSAPATGEQ